MSKITMRPQAILDGHTTSGECTACGERFSNAGVPGAAGEAKLSAAFLWHVTKKHSPAASGPAPAPASRGPKKLRTQNVAYAMAVVVFLIAANFAYRMYVSRQQTTAVYPIDQALQKDVRSALTASDVFEREQISVSVHNGVATLTGTVHEGWKQLVAANLAAGVAGVTEVKNLIQVHDEPDQTKAPWPQAGDTPAAKPRRQIVPSPEERAQSLVNDGNWQLSHGHRDAAIKDFQAAMAFDSHNYAAQSGLQEAELFR
jgi:hypothetical protein